MLTILFNTTLLRPTEIWNLETGSGEIVNQATIGVSNPIAFGVDLDFCAQS